MSRLWEGGIVTESKPLRVGVVGTGNWGRVHIEAYWRSPDTELVAICGSANRERAEKLGRQYGATPYIDMSEMIEKERLDLLSIITPDDQHFAPYRLALEAKMNCLLEKPLTMNVEEGRELVALARRQGVYCGINFNHRYATPFQLVKQHLEEGKVGRLLHLTWRFTGGHYPERQTMPLAHLLYMQSHGFNMLQTFGGPIASITGHAFDPRGSGQYTTAAFSLQFQSGAVGTFLAGVDGDYKDPDIYGFEVMGDRGRVKVDDTVRRFEFAPRPSFVQSHQEQKGAESLALVWNSHFFDDDSRNFSRTTDRHIADFVCAMREGRPEPIPIEEGLAALEAGQLAIDSVRPTA
jgi:predicted dehydrogenase